MNQHEQKGILEGLLFVSGEEGIYPDQISQVLGITINQVRTLVGQLVEEYASVNRGFTIVQFANAYRLTTKREHAHFYEKLIETPSSNSLSQAALETLAIVAYRQPITRTEIEEIRGVKTEKPIQTLVSRLLIKEIGRAEGTGRPILYGTTKEFMDLFGLKTIEELPPLPEDSDIVEEADLFFGTLNDFTKE